MYYNKHFIYIFIHYTKATDAHMHWYIHYENTHRNSETKIQSAWQWMKGSVKIVIYIHVGVAD